MSFVEQDSKNPEEDIEEDDCEDLNDYQKGELYNELCKCDIQFGCWFHSHHHSFSRTKESHHHDETHKRKYVAAELLETEHNYVKAHRTINLVRFPRSCV
jgi:hypothetical protein